MRALFAGSFDPVTVGHLDVISRLTGLLDSLVVAVAINPEKRSLFSIDERMAMLREACRHWPHVEVRAFTGLVATAAHDVGADCLIRGVRGSDEFAREEQMALANRALTGIETLLLPASPQVSFISSSLVREVAAFGGDILPFVPAHVAEQMRQRMAKP